ncbi:MAG: lipid-A-disaccharide synthase [Bacteroidales bacterium]|nr:lipid-A-disaccharide synthase [Bacteroidales bacterium]
MRYYIIAGEASGDLHGANLMRALLCLDPQAEFRFWGGDAMSQVAGKPVRHIRDLAIMGFVEVLQNLSTVTGNLNLCKQDILQFNPHAIVYIDYPGFNLRIARFAHDKGFLNIHYISPQLWAWKKGRIRGMRRNLDCLCYILPFEQDFYARNNFPQAVYVGHPLLDAVERFKNMPADQSIPVHPQRPLVALLPGSRRQELKTALPPMLQVARKHPEYDFVIAGMTLLGDRFYQPLIQGIPNVSIVYDKTYPLLASARAALVCSGTATLETALFNVPQVVCYRANAVSAAIARVLIGDKIKYISLVNLIADAPIVTELIQQDFSADRLEQEFLDIVQEGSRRQSVLDGYARVHSLLGNAGASDRTAAEIIKLIRSRQ